MSKGINPMNLVILDIDGTLTQSYEYDRVIFRLAISEVIGCNPVDVDLESYVNTTSLGVTLEAFERIIRRSAKAEEIEDVKRRVLWHLERMFQESPGIYIEVPGASRFLERLKRLDGAGIAIATGGWLSEALFKLRVSGLTVNGIPMATSDDHKDRKRIMGIAVERAKNYYACPGFKDVVYVGDGPWDMHASHALGYGFIGIGPRLEALKDKGSIVWHEDFLEIEAVFASFAAFLRFF